MLQLESPEDKIIDLSPSEYFDGKSIEELLKIYTIGEVHLTRIYKWDCPNGGINPIEDFADQVPIDAEIVLGFKYRIAGSGASDREQGRFLYCAHGLAFIKREEKPKKDQE